MRNNILVLGSGHQKKIKNIDFAKIYAANASIIKSKNYSSDSKKISINLVTTVNSLKSDIPTRRNANIIKPKKIFIRRGNQKKFNGINFSYVSKNFSSKKQKSFQNKFFYFGKLLLFISEILYGNSFIDKFNYLKNYFIYKKNFLGVSTGFFSILLALDENPRSKIFISGISMSNSYHFYKLIGKEKKIMTRHKVDKFMIKFLKKKFKLRMYTNDKKFSEIAKINFL